MHIYPKLKPFYPICDREGLAKVKSDQRIMAKQIETLEAGLKALTVKDAINNQITLADARRLNTNILN